MRGRWWEVALAIAASVGCTLAVLATRGAALATFFAIFALIQFVIHMTNWPRRRR